VTLDRVRRFALSLPGTTEEPHFDRTSFRVRQRIFATALPDDPHLNVFVDDEQTDRGVCEHPGFLEELTWGKRRGGLRVFLPDAIPSVVDALLVQAWSRRAPKRLAARRARPL
jgi:hypothetical protein